MKGMGARRFHALTLNPGKRNGRDEKRTEMAAGKDPITTGRGQVTEAQAGTRPGNHLPTSPPYPAMGKQEKTKKEKGTAAKGARDMAPLARVSPGLLANPGADPHLAQFPVRLALF